MKKLYTLLFLTLGVCTSNAQWAGFTNNNSTGLWSDDANWTFPSGVTELGLNWNIDIYQGPTTADINEAYTAKRFRFPSNKTEDFYLNGDEMLTIDIANTTQPNENSGDLAIWNEAASAQLLSFNCDVTIANSVTPEQFKGVSVISTATVGSIIEFDEGNSLTISGNGSTSFWGPGEVHIKGDIIGTQGVLVGTDSKVLFGSNTSDVSGYTGSVTTMNNSNITFNSNGTSNIATSKIQCNGLDATITLESENVITPNELRVSTKASQTGRSLTMNINANQTFSGIKIKGNSSVLTLNIDPSVTSVVFSANNANWNTSATPAVIDINGYKEGVVKFGIDNAGLNGGAYLANIKINGEYPSAEHPLSLDSNGALIGASDKVLSTNKHNAFKASVYPNPAQNMFTISTQESLKSIDVYNVLGKKVLSQNGESKTVNISSLKSGIYIVKMTSNKGITSQRIVIE